MTPHLPKPKIGEKCNGCGLCCMMQVCMNGAYVQRLVNALGETIPGPCPALVRNNDGSYACGIVLQPKKYIKGSKYPEEVLRKNFAHMIGASRGCDELMEHDSDEESVKLDQMILSTKADPVWVKKTKIALKVIHGIEI